MPLVGQEKGIENQKLLEEYKKNYFNLINKIPEKYVKTWSDFGNSINSRNLGITSGIYCLYFVIEKVVDIIPVYIGQSVNIYNRLSNHKSHFINNHKVDKFMKTHKLNNKDMKITILKECSGAYLNFNENKYINCFGSRKYGFNSVINSKKDCDFKTKIKNNVFNSSLENGFSLDEFLNIDMEIEYATKDKIAININAPKRKKLQDLTANYSKDPFWRTTKEFEALMRNFVFPQLSKELKKNKNEEIVGITVPFLALVKYFNVIIPEKLSEEDIKKMGEHIWRYIKPSGIFFENLRKVGEKIEGVRVISLFLGSELNFKEINCYKLHFKLNDLILKESKSILIKVLKDLSTNSLKQTWFIKRNKLKFIYPSSKSKLKLWK